MSAPAKKMNIPALSDEALDRLLRALQYMAGRDGITAIIGAQSPKFMTAGGRLRRRVPRELAARKASAAGALARLGLRVSGDYVEIRTDHPAIVAAVAASGAYDGGRWDMLAYNDLASGSSAWRTVLRLPGARVPAASTANPKIARVPAAVFVAGSAQIARAIAQRFRYVRKR